MTSLQVLARCLLCAAWPLALAAADAAAQAQPGPQAQQRGIVVANRHLAPVQQIYLSASSEPDWGPDRLRGVALAVDDDTTLAMDGGCQADLRIVFATSGAEERRNLDICQTRRIVLRPGWVLADDLEDEAPVPGQPAPGPGPGALRLRNIGPLPIVEIYTGPPGGARGEDRLGEDTLPIGMTIEIEPVDPDACTVDLVAVFRNGREVVQPGVDLCAGEEIEIR